MDYLSKLKSQWKKEFNCEIPSEFVDRVECQISGGEKLSSGKVINNFTTARDKTKASIIELKSKLQQEQFLCDFLSSEIADLEQQKINETEKLGTSFEIRAMYAKVNKPPKCSQQPESEVLNVKPNDQKLTSPYQSDVLDIYEDINMEIIEKEDTRPKAVDTKLSGVIVGKKPTRGSVKDKIKMFNRSVSSSSDESGDVDEDYEPVNVKLNPISQPMMPRPSPASRRRPRCDEYEEICLPVSAPAQDTKVESPSAHGNTTIPISIHTQNTDNATLTNSGIINNSSVSTETATVCTSDPKQEESISLSNQSEDVKPKLSKTPPPVPVKRYLNRGEGSREVECELAGDILKQTENSTLKFSECEPQISSSVSKKHNQTEQDIKSSEVRENIRVDSTIDDNDIEGDYCSITTDTPEIKKHVTLVQVKSGGSEKSTKSDKTIISNSDTSKTVEIISSEKPSLQNNETDEKPCETKQEIDDDDDDGDYETLSIDSKFVKPKSVLSVVKKADRELSRSVGHINTIGSTKIADKSNVSRSSEHVSSAGHYEDLDPLSFIKRRGSDEDQEMRKLFPNKSGRTLSSASSHKSDEDSQVVGKKFKSLSSSGSDRSDEDLMKTVPIHITLDTAEDHSVHIDTRSESPVLSKKEKRRNVPDYEKWNFQALLTNTGISAADNEHFNDTGSEDENVYDNVPESESVDVQDTVAGQSDDSGVCESSTPEDFKVRSPSVEDAGSPDFSPELRTKNAMSLDNSDSSRFSTLSCVTLNADSVFLQRCDSIDSPTVPPTLHEEGQDDDAFSICSMDDQLDKPEYVDRRTEQLRMRHLVVKAILESEKSYLHVVEQLVKAKHYLQTVAMKGNSGIALEDVTTIFYKLEDIFQVHKEFIDDLEVIIKDWNHEQCIAKPFKTLVVYFKVYEEYVDNYPKAVDTIRKYQENEDTKQLLERKRKHIRNRLIIEEVKQFKSRLRPCSLVDVSQSLLTPFSSIFAHLAFSTQEQLDMCKDEAVKLEDILLKPVQRIQTNNLVLHDILKHTPEDHPDHKDLMKALKLSEENLKTYNAQSGNISSANPPDQRHLVKSGFVVEVSKDKKNSRQLRYVFLFSDILICTKHKGSSKHKEVSFKYVWSLPLKPLSLHVKGEHKYSLKESLDDLKNKIGNLKVELREEMLRVDSIKDKSFSITQRRAARNVEKLKKKIQEQEATLVEGLPRLPLNLEVDGFKSHTFLFPTDYERVEWREALETHRTKCIDLPVMHLSVHDCDVLINNTKLHTQVNAIGTVLLKKDEEMLNGSLNVTIHKMQGLESDGDVYCCLEMDSYGHFYKKAQTRAAPYNGDASWDQDFELDLDGSQTLRILCYKKQTNDEGDVIIGKCALELSLAWLNSKFNEKTIFMNEVSITISIRHTPASKTLKRTQSKLRTGIFGVNIANVTRRENKTVPSIVPTCVQQVEKRGLEEVGIYRVSGVTSEIQHLKKLFDKNPIAASVHAEDVDIHAITGVLKLYFRELPEPLFTDHYYQSYIQTIELQNEEAKEKCMMELLHSLPEANYYTIVYIVEHLVRVAKQCTQNKMSISNLSTIFGPTLLHPAVKENSIDPMVQMARATRDASVQSQIIHFFIKLAMNGKNLRKSATTQSGS